METPLQNKRRQQPAGPGKTPTADSQYEFAPNPPHKGGKSHRSSGPANHDLGGFVLTDGLAARFMSILEYRSIHGEFPCSDVPFYSQFKRAYFIYRETHTRAHLSHELIRLLLQLGGVELNPGPHGAGGASKAAAPAQVTSGQVAAAAERVAGRREGPKARQNRQLGAKKAQKHASTTLGKVVEEERADQQARKAAAQDVRTDAERERDEAIAAAKEAADQAQYVANMAQLIHWLNHFPETDTFYIRAVEPHADRVDFLPISAGEMMRYSCECAFKESELPASLLPHTVYRCELTHTPQLTADERLPQQTASVRLPRGRFSELAFKCFDHRVYGYGGKLIAEADYDDEDGTPFQRALLSAESLLQARQRRLGASGDFHVTRLAVQAHRMHNIDVNHHAYRPQSNTWLSDLVFTALCLLDARMIGKTPTMAGLTNQVLTTAALRTLNEVQPLAGGTYVVGYDASLSEVMPDPEPLSRQAGIVLRKAVEVPSRVYRDAMAHCVLAPTHIKDLLPCFPNPYKRRNRIAGYVKRLCLAPIPPTPRGAGLIGKMTDCLIRRVLCTDNTTIGPTKILFETIVNARPKHKGPDLFHYAAGAWLALVHSFGDAGIDVGSIGLADDEIPIFLAATKALADDPDTKDPDKFFHSIQNGIFQKSETLDMQKVKGPRNIVAPELLFRGYTHAALYEVQHHFFATMAPYSVKGKNQAEQTDYIAERFSTQNSVIETDFTSMESNVTPSMILGVERPVFTACAPGPSKALVHKLMTFYGSFPNVILGKYESLILPPMRMSGQEHTSLGNYVCNWVWCHAILAEYLQADPDEIGMRYYLPVLFEGDDGFIALHDPLDQARMTAAVRQVGVRLKFDWAYSFADLNFCGATLRQIATVGGASPKEVFARMKNPLEVLSRAFSLFDPPDQGDSDHKREELAVAKQCSYFLTYHDMPAVGPVLQAKLKKSLDMVHHIYDDAVAYKEDRRARLATLWSELNGRGRLDEFIAKKTQLLDLLQAKVSLVASSTRASVAQLYGLSEPAQIAGEDDIIDQINRGETVLVHTPWTELWHKFEGVKRMTQQTVQDARKLVQERVTSPGSSEVTRLYYMAKGAERLASTRGFITRWAPFFLSVIGLITFPIPVLIALGAISGVVTVVSFMTGFALTGSFRSALRSAALALSAFILAVLGLVLWGFIRRWGHTVYVWWHLVHRGVKPNVVRRTGDSLFQTKPTTLPCADTQEASMPATQVEAPAVVAGAQLPKPLAAVRDRFRRFLRRGDPAGAQ